jgi:beta-N-acetylhexosaminidase
MGTRVSAIGEQTSLSDRKRRAGQRMLLCLDAATSSSDLRSLLRELRPAGFVLDPRGADEPMQLRELRAELAARLPSALPPLLAARHERGRPCAGTTDLPPLQWLAQADDPALSRALGQAWRRELAALGFQLHLGPACDLAALPGEPLPLVAAEPSLAGPDPGRAARTIAAFCEADQDAGCGAAPRLCQGWRDGDRLRSLEKELSGLLAEDLQPIEAAVGADVPALLLGLGRWAAFSEELPAAAVRGLLVGQLRERLGFAGLLLSEDPRALPAELELQLPTLLRLGVEGSLDQWLVGGLAEAWSSFFEALVKLQERHPALDDLLVAADRRLLAARERLLLGVQPAGLELLDSPSHRDLALMARARGGC